MGAGTMLWGRSGQIGRPEGDAWAGAGDSELLGSSRGGFAMRVGELTRIAWPLTGSVCSFIVRSIPEGLMFREFSSIWEIQAKRH